MQIKLFSLVPVLIGLGLLLTTKSVAQESRSLPPQIDSRPHFVIWADVDQVSFEEALNWAEQTELRPLLEVLLSANEEMKKVPTEFLRKLREAGAKRVYCTGELTALMGDPSALGLIILCDQPEQCAAALAANPLLPNQLLQPAEGAVLLAMSPEGLQRLAEIDGQPSTELAKALESTKDAMGLAAALPPAIISLFLQSAPNDGSPESDAVRRLVDLKWARACGSPPDSRLKLEATFDDADSAGKFVAQVNSICEKRFGEGEQVELLVADQGRVTLSRKSAKPIAGMVNAIRDSSQRLENMNKIRQLALAMHNFHDATGALPPQALADKAGKRLLSWRVLLLPYLQEQELYQQFHLDEAWDSPHNLALLEKMPALYRSAGEQQAGEVKPGHTRFVAPLTANSIMGKPGNRCRLQDIADGTSNTILLIQAAPSAAVPWTKPEDLVVDEANPLSGLVADGQNYPLFAFADGSVQALPSKLDPQTLKALLSRDDGEVVPAEKLREEP